MADVMEMKLFAPGSFSYRVLHYAKWILLCVGAWPFRYQATAFWVSVGDPERLDLDSSVEESFVFFRSMDAWVSSHVRSTKCGRALRVVYYGRSRADWQEGEPVIACDGKWYLPVGQEIDLRDDGIYVVG
jgi:hypothetical protein